MKVLALWTSRLRGKGGVTPNITDLWTCGPILLLDFFWVVLYPSFIWLYAKSKNSNKFVGAVALRYPLCGVDNAVPQLPQT